MAAAIGSYSAGSVATSWYTSDSASVSASISGSASTVVVSP